MNVITKIPGGKSVSRVKVDFLALIRKAGRNKRKQLWLAMDTNTDIRDFVEMLRLHPGAVDTSEEWVLKGLQALVDAGIISQGAVDKL